MSFKPEFRPIDYDSNLLGYWADAGDRSVEVICSGEDEWMCFATINDHVCRGVSIPKFSKSQATSWAVAFLNGEITPETWPSCIFVIGTRR